MSILNEPGPQLDTSPQKPSPFDEFGNDEKKPSFRLGCMPSLTSSIDDGNVLNVVTVFFRVCNSYSSNPFLAFLVYLNCNDKFEFPFIKYDYASECFETKANDLVSFVSKRAGIRYVNKIGYVGSNETRYVLCEVLNNDTPFDSTLRSSFTWLTTGELVKDIIMSASVCDNICLFIREATGACRLFRNNCIINGPRIGYFVSEHLDPNKLSFDSNFKIISNTNFWFSDYDLAILNGFFGTCPIEETCVICRHKLRSRFYLYRVVLPSDCEVVQCSLQIEEQKPTNFVKYIVAETDKYVISKHVIEFAGATNEINEFLNKRSKPFFSS